jgi:MoaA/NifB/PqqE/SkfB family radical SAM enzyme
MCQTHSPEIPDHEYRHEFTQDVSFDLFKKLANKFKAAIQIQFIGTGEPLLNKDLFRMIEYANRKKFEICVVTNGLLVEHYLYEIIHAPIDTFIVSINGHTEEEFNRMTGMSTKIWQKICEGANEIGRNEKRKFSFGLSFITDKTNVKYIQDMINFGARFKVKNLMFANFLPSNIKGFTTEERTIFLEDFNPFEAKKRLTVPKGISVTLPRPIDKTRTMKVCREFFRLLRIDGGGNVGGCGRQLLSLALNGHFADPDVWNNDYFRNMRSKFLQEGLELPDPCKSCFSNSPHEQIVLKG